MAAGEGGAESLPPPSPFLPGPERALEEAAASGKLSLAGRHLRHFPGGAARRWDLSDTTQAAADCGGGAGHCMCQLLEEQMCPRTQIGSLNIRDAGVPKVDDVA
ncbi:UNVERIFIED_CONTAM: hypothetical protein K2H54_040632 [Gekko kuhli]